MTKFALAVHGTRGDIEPCAAIGLELLRRGHEVRMAVPPNLVSFVESVGLPAVPYGPDSQLQLEVDFFRRFWTLIFRNPLGLIRMGKDYVTDGWAEMSSTLATLADGADLVLTGTTYQEVAANVAEHRGVPLAALHYFPVRINGRLVPNLPPTVLRLALKTVWWLYWRMTKEAENGQRDDLGLPHVHEPSEIRFRRRGALEIQAYEEFFFPGLAVEWAGRRPFVGAMTLELPTDVDDEVGSWIAAGESPIYFGFGSMPIESPADTVAMIRSVCAELGTRALICGGKFRDVVGTDAQVKIVTAVNHAAVFPACRAVVHHGGAGTTAAGLRAGAPTLILWVSADQPIWASQIRRLNVGAARRFAGTTRKSLVNHLRTILTPAYAARARDIATRMTKPAESAAAAADLLEQTARRGRFR